MKRFSPLLFFVFFLSTVPCGCLAGPGVEPPRAADEVPEDTTQAGAGGTISQNDPGTPAGSGGMFAPATGGSGTPTMSTGGIGGTSGAAGSFMDASIADGGGTLMESGIGGTGGGSGGSGAVVDDDAGPEEE